jgi:hypothetical protein
MTNYERQEVVTDLKNKSLTVKKKFWKHPSSHGGLWEGKTQLTPPGLPRSQGCAVEHSRAEPPSLMRAPALSSGVGPGPGGTWQVPQLVVLNQ